MVPWKKSSPSLVFLPTLTISCSVTCICHALACCVALSSCMAVGPLCEGLQSGTQAELTRCWTRLDFNVERGLWAMVFILNLLKTRLGLFHGGTEGDGTWGGNPLHFKSSVKLSTIPHPPGGASRNAFLSRHPKNSTSTSNRWGHGGHSTNNNSSCIFRFPLLRW